MPWKLILLIAAVIFFVLAGFNVPRYNWTAFGFACVTASLFLPT